MSMAEALSENLAPEFQVDVNIKYLFRNTYGSVSEQNPYPIVIDINLNRIGFPTTEPFN